MQTIDVSNLNVTVHKYPYRSTWVNKYKIYTVTIKKVLRLISNKNISTNLVQICFISKNGTPHSSVYFEGESYYLQAFLREWYEALQVEINATYPETWTTSKQQYYTPAVSGSVYGIQVYRNGRGRGSYMLPGSMSVCDDAHPNPNERVSSTTRIYSKRSPSNYPMQFRGLKTDVFSFVSLISDLLYTIEEDIPF